MSFGILPVDVNNLSHASAGIDGPLQGGTALDLTGTSVAGVHAGNATAVGDLSVTDPGGHLTVDPGTGNPVSVGLPGSDGAPVDVNPGVDPTGLASGDVSGVAGTATGLAGNAAGTVTGLTGGLTGGLTNGAAASAQAGDTSGGLSLGL